MSLEGGIGYFQTNSSVSDIISGIPVSLDQDLAVVPLTVTAKGIIPVQNAEFYAGAGIGIYFASIEADLSIGGLSDSLSDNDAVFGFHLLIGANFNIAPNVFLGVEAKPFWTDDAQASGEFFGIPVSAEGNLNGYAITGNLGFRF